jgi:XTP/dITP diphosphohydrolase
MKLIFATHNPNKLKEIKAMMPGFIKLGSLDDINCTEDIAETADTIAGNAQIKADYVFENYKVACFADDTGLEVDALQGEPGVHSARYAGEDKNDTANMQKLLRELDGKNNRKAQFKTVIALKSKDRIRLFEGICPGAITQEKSGEKGFGYDPIFKPDGFEQTFAQMNQQQKAEISHRGIAFRKLIEFLKKA